MEKFFNSGRNEILAETANIPELVSLKFAPSAFQLKAEPMHDELMVRAWVFGKSEATKSIYLRITGNLLTVIHDDRVSPT